jgi:hypothetical protein
MKMLMIVWMVCSGMLFMDGVKGTIGKGYIKSNYDECCYFIETFSVSDTVKCIARFNEINSDDKKIYEVTPMELTLKQIEEPKKEEIHFQIIPISTKTMDNDFNQFFRFNNNIQRNTTEYNPIP